MSAALTSDAVARERALGAREAGDRRREVRIDGDAVDLLARGKPGPAMISGTREEPS